MAIAAAGNILGSVLGFLGQRKANKQNIALSREQMAFQERMSNSAYQRAMKDMKLAGLNPILAAKQPASTPGGSSTRVESALGAGVQAFNNTNSAQAAAANQRASAQVNSAKAQRQFAINNALYADHLDPKQKAINAALAEYGMTPAITNLLTSAVTNQNAKEFKRILGDVSSEMAISIDQEHAQKIFEAMIKIGDTITGRKSNNWNPFKPNRSSRFNVRSKKPSKE